MQAKYRAQLVQLAWQEVLLRMRSKEIGIEHQYKRW
jgi:hypothetical protein